MTQSLRVRRSEPSGGHICARSIHGGGRHQDFDIFPFLSGIASSFKLFPFLSAFLVFCWSKALHKSPAFVLVAIVVGVDGGIHGTSWVREGYSH